MEKRITKVSEFPVLSRSPFAEQLIKNMRSKKVILGSAPADSGEEATFLGKVETVDSKHFLKVFNDGLKKFFDLNKNDMKVLSFIMHVTPMKSDRVRVLTSECMKFTDIKSRTTLVRCLVTLIENEFIAKSDVPHMYWINPNIFFRGDRLVLAREYRKITVEPTQEKSQYASLNDRNPDTTPNIPMALHNFTE